MLAAPPTQTPRAMAGFKASFTSIYDSFEEKAKPKPALWQHGKQVTLSWPLFRVLSISLSYSLASLTQEGSQCQSRELLLPEEICIIKECAMGGCW